MSQRLKITWVRSTIGTRREHRATIRALGLKRLRQSVVREDSAQVRGMLRLVDSLVRVEEVEP